CWWTTCWPPAAPWWPGASCCGGRARRWPGPRCCSRCVPWAGASAGRTVRRCSRLRRTEARTLVGAGEYGQALGQAPEAEAVPQALPIERIDDLEDHRFSGARLAGETGDLMHRHPGALVVLHHSPVGRPVGLAGIDAIAHQHFVIAVAAQVLAVHVDDVQAIVHALPRQRGSAIAGVGRRSEDEAPVFVG